MRMYLSFYQCAISILGIRHSESFTVSVNGLNKSMVAILCIGPYLWEDRGLHTCVVRGSVRTHVCMMCMSQEPPTHALP